MQVFATRKEMMRHFIIPESVVVEIGVWRGEFSEYLVSLNPAKLHLIDPWKGVVPSGDVDGNFVSYADLDSEYLRMVDRYRTNDKVVLHRAFSGEAIATFQDASIDIAYIDGDHSYDGVLRDLEALLPKMKKNGIICGHDYEMNLEKAHTVYNFGVKRAVDEWCSKHGLTLCAKALDGCVSFAIKLNSR